MTAPQEAPASPATMLRTRALVRRRGYPIGAPVEVLEDGPSLGGRLVSLACSMTIKPVLAAGSALPHAPWPWGMLDGLCRVLGPTTGSVRAQIDLPDCGAVLIRADGVLPADGTRRVILYLHGGAFITCGVNTHVRLMTALSRHADAPVLAVNYRMLPKHTISEAVDDCHSGYRWLRLRGYDPDQIVVAGDSAGGYLSLTLAQRLQAEGEQPAAVVAMSPVLQLAKEPKHAHPNMKTDAMFPAKAFDAFVDLIARSAARRVEPDGTPHEVYEPLDHIEPGLPPTLIHVSGSEVLLHDARLAARRLAAVGVPVEVHVWPGQMHVFQIAAPIAPEADRSLRQIGEYIKDATE